MIEEFVFSESESKQFEQRVGEEMEKPIKHYEKELSSIRTGRASTMLLEGIKAESYGQLMPLRELATLATPDARLITIQPWDKSVIPAIEKAIRQSDIGITPANDGTVIRLQLPQMSEARRDELVKVLGKKTEECRIGIRNVRREYHNQIRKADKDHGISEDFAKRLSDTLQKITDSYVKKTDEINQKKEKEIRLV